MDPKSVKASAAGLLAQADHDPQKLSLFYAGVTTGFSLICTLLSFLLGLAADRATGLSGLAMRSMLESGQMVLSLASTVLLPFWQMGFLYTAFCYSKQRRVDNHSLLEGFRRWGAVLRLNILLAIVFTGLIMVCSYIAIMIFTLSPLSDTMAAELETMLNTTTATTMTPEMLMTLAPHMDWLFVILFAVLVIVGLPFYYRYRLSEFALLDDAKGALMAIRQSKRLSWNNRMGLFKLDLSFWWFYLGQIAISLIAYGDALLPALGLHLPFGENGAFWVFYLVSMGLQFFITYRYALYYQTSVALYYNRLKDSFLTPITPPPDPTQM